MLTQWAFEFLDPAWIRTLMESPFLVRCQNNTLGRQEAETFLVQHYHYAKHFTRCLAALISNLGVEADRQKLIQNLFEEMGCDGKTISHAQLYLKMLHTFGLRPESHPPSVPTQDFATCMLSLCAQSNALVGLGALCLGAEAIVPLLYSTILRGLLGVGYPRECLEYFALHIESDDLHAESMAEILRREVKDNPRQRVPIRNAARQALKARKVFFDALSQPAFQPSRQEALSYAI